MCNHYRIKEPDRVLPFARKMATEVEFEWETREGAWPQYQMPVVYQGDGIRKLTSMRWGVWPWYEEKPSYVSNARDDKLLSATIWKESAKKRRCVVPADGWYEWAGPKGLRFEVLFQFSDNRPFWIAGLWSEDPRPIDEASGKSRGFTLVTGKPNDLLASVPHDRMIVLLDEANAMRWIGETPLEDQELLGLCAPYPDTELVREDQPRVQRAAPAKSKGKALKAKDLGQKDLLAPEAEP